MMFHTCHLKGSSQSFERSFDDLFIIGDLHGRYDVLEKAHKMSKDRGGILVCVGDLFDSFDRSTDDQLRCVDIIANNDDISCISGNHDIAYLDGYPICSGRSRITKLRIGEYVKGLGITYERFISRLPCALVIDTGIKGVNPILVTHAGLTANLLRYDQYLLFKDEVFSSKEVVDLINSQGSELISVGAARGGWDKVGGIFWCDLEREFAPIPNLPQVFGHSRVPAIKTIVCKGDTESFNDLSFAIDCLDCKQQILHIYKDNGEIKWEAVKL